MKKLLLLSVFIILVGGGSLMVYNKVRGIRNNNPGNIKRSNDRWQGLSDLQDDPIFFKFTDAVWGIRALLKLLTNYESKYGLSTIAGIIGRWAPDSENPTNNYVAFVSNKLGVDPYQKINVTERRLEIAKAIVLFENGLNPYSDETFKKAEGLL